MINGSKKIEAGVYDYYFGGKVIGRVKGSGRNWTAVFSDGTTSDRDSKASACYALREPFTARKVLGEFRYHDQHVTFLSVLNETSFDIVTEEETTAFFDLDQACDYFEKVVGRMLVNTTTNTVQTYMRERAKREER